MNVIYFTWKDGEHNIFEIELILMFFYLTSIIIEILTKGFE
jgi:hypothetical protein